MGNDKNSFLTNNFHYKYCRRSWDMASIVGSRKENSGLESNVGLSETIVSMTWSPTGHDLSVVTSSRLLVLSPPSMDSIRPVSSVSPQAPVMYTEHVWRDDSCVWWSPTSQSLAYILFSEDKFSLNIANISRDEMSVDTPGLQLDTSRWDIIRTMSGLVSHS